MSDKISVIVPVFKVEDYLHRCVDSIIMQTHQNLEIILVNDGSPDDSGKICDEYATKDDRVIVIHKKNEGSSCARNAGLDIATGNYISFVDSDDYINVVMLEKMLKNILEFDLDVIEIPPKFSYRDKIFDDKLIIEDSIQASKRVIQDVTFAVWRRVFKKSIIEDMRFIPGIIHQDVFYTMDMLKRINKYGFLNSELYYYNSDSESIIRSKYSLHKITVGIRATEYIINNVIEHPELKIAVNDYVNHYYTDHYFLLSRNTFIDKDRSFRKKLKRTIFRTFKYRNATFRALLVIILPYKVLELISSGFQNVKKGNKNK